MAVIEHPPGEETQFDWLELPDPPAQWGWGSKAFLLVGALAHSGRWRGVLAESTDQPHLIDALHRVVRRAGWADPHLAVRPDGHRLPPRHRPDHRLVRRGRQALRGVGGDLPAPARQPQGRGGEGQPHRRAALVAHPGRRVLTRAGPGVAGPVVSCCAATPACARPATDGPPWPPSPRAEPLASVPAPFPAVLTVERTASAQALVAFRGNRYSVPPELARAQVTVTHRLGATHIDLATSSGIIIARHAPGRRPGPAPPSATPGTSWPWSAPRWPRSPTAAPHRRKQRIPPGPAARAAADALRATTTAGTSSTPDTTTDTETDTAGEVVIDLARYAAAAQGRNTLR